jgi:hypothetical protein
MNMQKRKYDFYNLRIKYHFLLEFHERWVLSHINVFYRMAGCLTKILFLIHILWEVMDINIDGVNPFTVRFGCDINYVGCPKSNNTNTIKSIQNIY